MFRPLGVDGNGGDSFADNMSLICCISSFRDAIEIWSDSEFEESFRDWEILDTCDLRASSSAFMVCIWFSSDLSTRICSCNGFICSLLSVVKPGGYVVMTDSLINQTLNKICREAVG